MSYRENMSVTYVADNNASDDETRCCEPIADFLHHSACRPKSR